MRIANSSSKWLFCLSALGLLLAASGVGVHIARANGIPATKALTYVGTLEGTDGQLIEGPHDIALAVWDSGVQGEGTKWCEVPAQSLIVKAGRFELSLPDTCPAGFNDRSDTFLEITVDGESMGRSKVGAVPYAVEADTAGKARLANQAAAGSPLAQQVSAAGVIEAWKDCEAVVVIEGSSFATLTAEEREFTAHRHTAKCRRAGDSVEVMGAMGPPNVQIPCSLLFKSSGLTTGDVKVSLSVVGYPLDRTKLANFTQVGSGLTGERVGVLLSTPLSPIGDVTWDSRVKFRFANDSQTLPTDAVAQCKRGSASAAWTGTIFHSFTSYRLTLPVQGFSATVAP